jgi:hypothetical protein
VTRETSSLCSTGMFIPINNERKARLMGHEGNYIDNETTSNCLPMPCETYGFMRCKFNPCHHSLRVAWPPDALSRLLMEADGVTESALDALLKRVVQKRPGCWPMLPTIDSVRERHDQNSGG